MRLILFGLVMCSLAVSGQRLIPKAGITFSFNSIYRSEDEKALAKTGATVGFGMEFPLVDNLLFVPELSIIQKGFNHAFQGGRSYYYYYRQTKLRLEYLELATLVKGRHTWKKSTIFYGVGPSIGFCVFGKLSMYDVDGDNARSDSYHISIPPYKDNFYDGANLSYIDRPVDIAVQSLIGIELFEKIQFEIRFGQSLTKLYTEYRREEVSGYERARNRVWQFSIAAPFPRKAKKA